MAGSDDETVVDETPAARAPAGELQPGTLLNGIYRIEARLGVGGMGEVYRATNLANEEEDAIKIIGRARADQTMIEAMFRKEARVLSRIRSPAVAQLKVFMRDPALNLLYFVTDFVPGESLLDRLKRQPATPDELRALMRRVLTGLQAVHEAGAVHRDLSPDNIILPDGDPAHAKIIDFGIAKELDPDQTTMIGDTFAGKLGYIAPEQLGFSGSKIGPWTDLYSLALVGVAFAAGKPLDMGATIGRAEETRRGAIDLSAVPEDVRPVFERMLVYDWRERAQSASATLDLIDRNTKEISASPTLSTQPEKLPFGRANQVKSRKYQISANTALTILIVIGVISILLIVLVHHWDNTKLSSGNKNPVTKTTLMGLHYQVIKPGNSASRIDTVNGWADIRLTFLPVNRSDGGFASNEATFRVPPDRLPSQIAELVPHMVEGAEWRILDKVTVRLQDSPSRIIDRITILHISSPQSVAMQASCKPDSGEVTFEPNSIRVSDKVRQEIMEKSLALRFCPISKIYLSVIFNPNKEARKLAETRIKLITDIIHRSGITDDRIKVNFSVLDGRDPEWQAALKMLHTSVARSQGITTDFENSGLPQIRLGYHPEG